MMAFSWKCVWRGEFQHDPRRHFRGKSAVPMTARDRPVYRIIFLVVLAPIGAAVTIGVLLLFGVEPHRVFWFGFVVKSWLRALGLPAPNAAGVLSTVFLWWVGIAALGLAWERFRRQGRRPDPPN